MASGTLGQSSLTAATNTTLYTAGATPSTFNVSVLNTTAIPVAINLAIAAAATPVAGEYIEYNTVIPPNSVLERGALVCTSGKLLVGYAYSAGIQINVYGFEG